MIKKLYFVFTVFYLCFSLCFSTEMKRGDTVTYIDEIYNEEQTFPSPEKPHNRPSVALVLSGGGARGFAHLPVLEMIEEYSIPVDIVIGTSVGSIIGGVYSAGYSVEELEKKFFDLNWSDIFQDRIPELYETRLGKSTKSAIPFSIDFKYRKKSFGLNLGSGILSGQFAYELMKKMTLAMPSDCDFDTLPIPFRAVAVNLTTGDVEAFCKGDMAEAIRCSMSIPAFFQPFEVDGEYYIDGGTRNNTPIDIAVKMGYDIIIVSEISTLLNEDYESFKKSPVEALIQMTNLEQSVRNREIYKKASLVMFPDYNGCTILDFAKSKDIYKSSLRSMEKYRSDFARIKKEIEERTTGISYTAQKRTVSYEESYKDNAMPVVTTVSVTGGNEQDKRLVERAFSAIKGKKLSPQSYESFEKAIYKSGKYEAVLTRIKQVNSSDSNMEVILSKKQDKDLKFSLGAEYKGTVSTDAMNDVSLLTELRKENFLGKGSILSLRTSFFTDYSLCLSYIQPFGSAAFSQFSVLTENDRSIVSSGFDYHPMEAEQMLKNVFEFSLGFPISSWFMFTAGSNFGFYNTNEKIDGGTSVKAVDFFAKESINLLNSTCLPSEGFFFELMGESVCPIENFEAATHFDVEQVSVEGVIPLHRKFSLLVKGFGGGNLNERMIDYPELLPVFGFYAADRSYFPQVAASTEYGIYKVAAATSLMFCPWDQLTILGGKAFIALSGAAGNIWYKNKEVSQENSIWRASADLGIRFSEFFGIVIRGGVGKTHDDIYPFFSVDLGKVQF